LLTLARAERSFEALPIGIEIARVFASLFSEARQKGRRPKTMNMWIAATAVHYGLPVFTYDSDFDVIPRLRVAKQ
jgi:predicted nucleic acid-binding protein